MAEITDDRAYSAADRKTMAGNGQAMPDGSYPIANKNDLANAIHAVGRGGGSHDAIRRHIIKRAKALGASDMVPANWNADGSMRADDRGYEERTFGLNDVEVREGSDGMVTLAGYASTFNDPYKVNDRFGGFAETILPGAWADTIREAPNIHLMVGHGAIPIPVASTRAGTLRLSEDSHGLPFEADLNPQRSGLHRDVAYAVESRAMDEMSVGMRIPSGGDSWNDDNSERYISRAELIEISVLPRGANPNTQAGLRNEDIVAEIRRLEGLLTERGEMTDATERHLAGLTAEMARLHKRRYLRL